MSDGKETASWTFGDLLAREEKGDWVELYDGEPCRMEPVSEAHQNVARELILQIGSFLRGKESRLFHAPYAVRLFEGQEEATGQTKTVVRPDLTVVCDGKKRDSLGCRVPRT